MAENPQSEKLLLSIHEAAALTGLHPETVKRLARAGNMPGATKFSKNGPWKFRRHELMAHVLGDGAAVSETRAQVG